MRRIVGFCVLALVSASIAQAAPILVEDFEDGVLDPLLSVATTGTPNPDIKPVSNLGSTMSFGFGRSNCPFNCFLSHVSSLTATFATPTFVESVSFREMELFENWGSKGIIVVDGTPLTPGVTDGISAFDFGRRPSNDRTPDTTFREWVFPVGQTISMLELRVVDITNLSELFLDDLVIEGMAVTTGTTTTDDISEPTTLLLLGTGLGLAALRRRRAK